MKRSLTALFVLSSFACASAPARPVPPPTPHIETGALYARIDPAMSGVEISIDANGQGQTLLACPDTDERGITLCAGVPAGEHRIYFEHIPDVDNWEVVGDNPIVVQVAANENTDVVIRLKPVSRAHQDGFLHVCGLDFCDEDGKPWLFAGYATYTLISEVAKGHDINPLFDEAASYGANTIVALGMDGGDWAKANGAFVDPRDPQWASWLATIFDTAAAHQMRVALAVFQQAQILSDGERRQAFATAANVARGRWNVLLRCGNEDDVNGWRHDSPDCTRPPDMQGVLLSTGSRGINNPPVPPNFDWAEWEPRRGPINKAMDDGGAGAWEMYTGYPGFAAVQMPIVAIEPPFFHDTPRDQWGDERWTDPKMALRLAVNIGANFAGGTFGSSQSLESKPNGPIAAECARQFFLGLRAGFQR